MRNITTTPRTLRLGIGRAVLVTLSWVGNPRADTWLASKDNLLSTASCMMMYCNVHVPDSANWSMVNVPSNVPPYKSPEIGLGLTPDVSNWPLDGLRNRTSAGILPGFTNPDKASVMWNVTVVVAGPLVTSTVVGLKLKSTNTGGSVSGSASTTETSRATTAKVTITNSPTFNHVRCGSIGRNTFTFKAPTCLCFEKSS